MPICVYWNHPLCETKELTENNLNITSATDIMKMQVQTIFKFISCEICSVKKKLDIQILQKMEENDQIERATFELKKQYSQFCSE